MRHVVASLDRPVGIAVLVLAGIVLFAARARADESPVNDAAGRAANVSKLTEEGFDFYKARDYRHANEKFLQAYALDQDPNLLFNMARCYEATGDRDSAIEKYEIFLAKPDADPQGKRRATAAIRSLRQAKVKTTGSPGAAQATGAVSATPGSESEHAVDAASASDRHSFLTPPVIVLGAGVVVAAVGAVVYSMGASDHGKVTDSAGYGTPGQVDPLTEAQARQLVDSGHSKKLMGGVALALGGALLATSAVLFATTAAHDHGAGATGKETARATTATTVTTAFGVAPTGTGTGGQLLMMGRF